jgi:iron(III) transport system substrate-binding protein
MKKLTLIGLLFALIALLVACSSEEKVEDTNATTDEGENKETEVVVEEPKIEGELQFYTSQPDTDATALVSKFNETYPDVEVKIFRSGTEEVIGKLLAENEAGEVQADVLLVADNVTFEGLKEKDLLESYESPEYSNIPAEFVDADFMYAGTKVMATVLAVNTNEVTELPTSWNVLTEAVSKDSSIMPSPLYSGAAAFNLGVLTRQDGFGWDYYDLLKANGVSVVQGNGAALKAVAGGEESYAMVVDYLITRAKAEGSPVEIVYPSEGVPVVTEPIGLLKDAKNKDAAKAFIDFVVSEDGQKLAAEIGYTPIRTGVEAPEGLKTISELTVISAPVSELIETRDADKLKFKEMFGE